MSKKELRCSVIRFSYSPSSQKLDANYDSDANYHPQKSLLERGVDPLKRREMM